jgi:hypothetical protein
MHTHVPPSHPPHTRSDSYTSLAYGCADYSEGYDVRFELIAFPDGYRYSDKPDVAKSKPAEILLAKFEAVFDPPTQT